jgi:Alkylmercury lyase
MSGSKPNPAQIRELYRFLLTQLARTGQPPSREMLQGTLGTDSDAVEQALTHLEQDGGIYRDPVTREILVAYPFSTKPTNHIVRFPDGHEVYAMCAIDALGMPAMLHTDAVIASRCAQCGRPIQVVVRDNTLAESAPPDIRVWYQTADATCIAAVEQCPSINFFCSPEHLDAWRALHPGQRGEELDVPRAFVRGREVFGNLLKAGGTKDGPSV